MPAEAAAAAPAAAPATPSPAAGGPPAAAVSPAPASAPAAAPAPHVAPSAAAPVAAEPTKPAAPEAAPFDPRKESLISLEDAAPAEEKPAEEAKPEDEKPAVEYTEFKLPEGVQVDAALMEKAKPIFAELGLSQEQAQKLIDLQADSIKELAQAPYKEWNDQQKKWQDEIKADKELGGANLAANMNAIRAGIVNVLGAEGAKEFVEALKYTGIANNPAFFRGMLKFAKPYSEGKGVTGNVLPMTPPKSLAGRLYPTTAKQE